ncbi:MAG: hypothetical protein BWY23_02004 [Spirochaetes bacterium ADurb.Bin218]|jgi:Fe2+ transport system protein B|nr:MAG: hypothetical protein BWY23_02004 [Spirochaetes bacterium ADurb.Bin218]
MPGRLSVEVYEIFERNFNNKEDALKIINAFEETINESVSVSWYKTKNEMLSEIFSVVATKEDLRSLRVELLGEMKKDKAEILGRLYALYEKTEKDKAELLGIIEQNKTELLGIIESNRIELNAKIDTIYLKLDRKITLWSFSIIFIIIFLNQNALEFIAKIIGLIK